MALSRTTGALAVLAVVVVALGALVSVLDLLGSSYVTPSAVVLGLVAAVALLGAALGSRAAQRLESAYW
ncbi:hypothetical protein [Halomarina litorea]|uniref:hypothetical protein n=1 Tax=Halomarina litorea TaxID=2961595 RepID=UPI0020C233F0|nr:hypothetical protein [Halomarina sp. BCD28]